MTITGDNNVHKQPVKQRWLTLVWVKVKVKQAWTGPEGSRRLRFPYFKTIGTFLDAATLAEVFPCFFLSCKANARV